MLVNNNLLIFGEKELGCSATEIANANPIFEKINFIDNALSSSERLKELEKLSAEYSYAYPAFNDSERRIEWIEKSEELGFRIPILVHPLSCIARSAQLRKGTIIEPMAVIKSNTSVGIGCVISAGAVIGDGTFVGDGCNIGSNSVISENTLVPAGTKIAPCSHFKLDRELKTEDLFFKSENIADKCEHRPQPHTPDVINGKVYSFEDGF